MAQTYRALFAVPQYKPFFVATALNIASLTSLSLALATLVFADTGSTLLTALTQFGPSAAQALGATFLLSYVDRLPPRATLIGFAVGLAAMAFAVAASTPPVPVVLGLVLLLGVANSLVSAVRYGLMVDILPIDAYVISRSVLNMTAGGMQLVGFTAGGVLIATLGVQAALAASGVLAVASAASTALGLRSRAPRVSGKAGPLATLRANRRLLADRTLLPILLALWVPNGLIAGTEALYVPLAGEAAATLFVAGALGMFIGDWVMGRLVPARWRPRLLLPFRFLIAAPYVLFLVNPNIGLAMAIVAVASAGFSASLILQERLIVWVPGHLRSHAIGLAGAGMMAMQAVGAVVAGLVAEILPIPYTIAVMGMASLLVTALLTKSLQRSFGAPDSSAGSN